MNAKMTLVSALALAAACTLAQAQDSGSTQRVEITAPGAAVRAAQAAQLSLDSETVYVMANGRKLTVSNAGDALRVRFGRQRAITVAHDGAGNFVSQDGTVSLRFEADARSDAGVVHATIPAAWL
jgi:hypothetical protein